MSCAALDYTKPMDDAVLVGSGWVVEEGGGTGGSLLAASVPMKWD